MGQKTLLDWGPRMSELKTAAWDAHMIYDRCISQIFPQGGGREQLKRSVYVRNVNCYLHLFI